MSSHQICFETRLKHGIVIDNGIIVRKTRTIKNLSMTKVAESRYKEAHLILKFTENYFWHSHSVDRLYVVCNLQRMQHLNTRRLQVNYRDVMIYIPE